MLAIACGLSILGARCEAQISATADWEGADLDEDVAADLEWLRDHPVDIASDPLAGLESVPGVPPGFAARAEQARAVLPFRRVEDLLRVRGVDAQLLARVRPFVSAPLPTPRTRGRVVFEASGGGASRGLRLAERAEFARGPGLRFGGALERDAREAALDDFSSAWIEAVRGGVRVIGGALDVDWGRGLALSSARAPTDVIGALDRALRAARGVTAHRGVAEEGHFRGVALEAGRGRLRLAAVVSDTRRDARVNRAGLVTSLVEGGLHRSASEAAARDRLRDRMIALRSEWGRPNAVRLGATWRANRFDPSLGPREGSALPSGSHETVAGIDFTIPIGRARIVSEMAFRNAGGSARLAGFALPVRALELTAMARRYEPGFRALHTTPPGASGRSSNERGLAVGARGRLRGWMLSAVHDRWGEITARSTGAPREWGTRTRLSAETGRAGRRIVAILGRTSRGAEEAAESAVDGDDGDSGRERTTLRLQGELPLPRGARAVVVASGVALADGAASSSDSRASTYGGYLQTRVAAPSLAGMRATAALTRFSGETASTVPRMAETLLPGRTLFVPLASGTSTAGSRASLALDKRVRPSLRFAIAASWHIPRGTPSRFDAGVAVELGRSRLP
jgi:hypothetical protein